MENKKKDVQVSEHYRCAECNRKLLVVRERHGDLVVDFRCPKCDADLRESEGW